MGLLKFLFIHLIGLTLFVSCSSTAIREPSSEEYFEKEIILDAKIEKIEKRKSEFQKLYQQSKNWRDMISPFSKSSQSEELANNLKPLLLDFSKNILHQLEDLIRGENNLLTLEIQQEQNISAEQKPFFETRPSPSPLFTNILDNLPFSTKGKEDQAQAMEIILTLKSCLLFLENYKTGIRPFFNQPDLRRNLLQVFGPDQKDQFIELNKTWIRYDHFFKNAKALISLHHKLSEFMTTNQQLPPTFQDWARELDDYFFKRKNQRLQDRENFFEE